MIFIILLLTVLSFTACGTVTPKPTNEPTPVEDEVLNDSINKVYEYAAQMIADKANNPADFSKGGFSWDTESKKDSWRYFNGVMIDGLAIVSDEGLEYTKKFILGNLNADGTPKNYHEAELDSVPMGLSLFYLLDGENAELAKKAIAYIFAELDKQPYFENCGGNYIHKLTWTDFHIGLDGLYMAQPFLMRCADAISKGRLTLYRNGGEVAAETIYKEVLTRMLWVADNMYDEGFNLYHHGWNAEQNFGNGHFWLRGIGWYAVALTDITELMPPEYKEDMKEAIFKLVEGMMQYQDKESKLWYNVVNNPTLENNLLETSGSAMMAYTMIKCARLGFLPTDYGDEGLEIFKKLVELKMVEKDGVLSVTDIYQKSGVYTDDAKYTVNPYIADEAKGTGVLIMTAVEADRYTSE